MKKIFLLLFLSCYIGSGQWQEVRKGSLKSIINVIAAKDNQIFANMYTIPMEKDYPNQKYYGHFISKNSGQSWRDYLISMYGSLIDPGDINSFLFIDDKKYIASVFGLTIEHDYSDSLILEMNIKSFDVKENQIFCSNGNSVLQLSNDNGENWHSITITPEGITTNSVKLSDGCLLAGTTIGILMSSDSGKTFLPKNMGITCDTVNVLACSESLFIAGTESGGIFISYDKGENWIEKNNGLTNKNIQSILLIGNEIFCLAGNEPFYTSNEGLNWSKCNGNLINTAFYSICNSHDTIYAGTNRGIFLSNNLGKNWIEINPVFRNSSVTSLNFIDSNLFAGSYSGIFKSSDLGNSWNYIDAGIVNDVILSMVHNDDYVFAGLLDSGLLISSDDGLSWTNEKFDNSNLSIISLNIRDDALFAGTDKGILVSKNDFKEWNFYNLGLTNNFVYSIFLDSNFIFIGTYDGVYSSKNNNVFWSNSNKGFADNLVAFNFARIENYLFAATNHDGIYFSKNNGSNWYFTNLSYLYTACLKVYGRHLFAGTEKGIYVSGDNGITWKQLGLRDEIIRSLEIFNNLLFVGTQSGSIYRGNLSELGISDVNDGNHYNLMDFSLSPNPATDFLEISYSPSIDRRVNPTVDGITIYNFFGIKIPPRLTASATPQQGNIRLDVSSLSSGVYFLKVGEQVGKFIKIDN